MLLRENWYQREEKKSGKEKLQSKVVVSDKV